MKLAVFGLGKLGSVIAAIHAHAGHEVVGVDLNENLISTLNQGKSPFLEPGLQELIDSCDGRLSATSDPRIALEECDASIIIVPTPSGSDGKFSSEFVETAARTISENVSIHSKRHTILIASTVMPGTCEGSITTAIESVSKHRVGTTIGLAYNPQFIALGSIVNNMERPDLVLIGQSDPDAGNLAELLALGCATNKPEVKKIGLTSAELAKIAINTFVTTKISFANMLAELCDNLPNADIDDVTSAVGADSRVGKKYLQGALGYGGPCFPRDNIALAAAAKNFNIDATIATATDEINDRQVERISFLVGKSTNQGSQVKVFGLSYKPDTPVCDESQSIEIANRLHKMGFDVTCYEELSSPSDYALLEVNIDVENTPNPSIYSGDVAVFTHPVGSFSKLDPALLQFKKIIDIWGSLRLENLREGTELIRPGRTKKETNVI